MSVLVGGILIGIGVGLIFIAAAGIVRLPDVFARMHAASKTTSLGLTFVFVGAAFIHGTFEAAWKLLLASAFLLVTQPVAVHVLGRAAHRAGVPMWEGTLWDELERPGGDPDANA